MLKCGFYEADITPSIGSDRPGAFDCRFITDIYEPLYAHAFAAQGEGAAVIFVSLDVIMLEKCDVDRIRDGISRGTGVPAGNIGVFAIHNHKAGPVADSYGDIKREEEYCSYMVRHSIDAGIMAFRRMEEARIGVASCEVEGIAFNRRFLMKDGSVRTNPGCLNPDIVKPIDVTDPELSVIRVDRADGTPMGMLANYTLHPDTTDLDEGVVAADYPGVMRKALRARYGEKISFVYMTGACGNVNHVDVTRGRDEQQNFLSIGKILSEASIRLFDGIKTEDVSDVRCVSTFKRCKTRRPTQAECDAMEIVYIKKEMLKAKDLPNKEMDLEVWSVKLGEILIHVLPGEVFTQFGLDIKKQTESPHTIVCELGHCNVGYIYTREAAAQGGYEATPTTYIIMDENTGYKLVEAAGENTKKLEA